LARTIFCPLSVSLSSCLLLCLRLLVSLSPCLLVSLSACGKIGDPLPPIPRAPLIINELNVTQQGTQLVLSFPLVRNARAPKLQRVDVYRLAEGINEPLGLTAESFATRAALIGSLTAEQLPTTTATVTYQDQLDLSGSARDVRYRYAVRLVNESGQAADFSNYATITPVRDLAAAPGNLQVTQREKEIEITWTAPASNESGTTPANVAAYNLYRRAGETVIKLNDQPLTTTRFIDRNFQFGAKYEYFVRPLSLPPGTDALTAAIESNASQPLAHTPQDTFPPVTPTSVTIASINNLVSIFWPLNAEPDVAGYNIYRAEAEDTPAAQWVKLNPQLHKTASFRDDRVQVGKQYFYQITAVDVYGNESPRSATVSETVNP
jgi:hypothetical protein